MVCVRDHLTFTPMQHRLTPAFNQPISLTDDEWGMLAQNPHVRARFGLTGANTDTDAEALIRGACGTFAARFDIDDYNAAYVLQDNHFARPPLVLTRDGEGRVCPHPCPDHAEPHVPIPIDG